MNIYRKKKKKIQFHSFPLFNKYITSHVPISQNRKNNYIYKKIKQKYKVLKQICLSLGKKNNNNQKREDLKLTWCKIAIRACDCCPVR